MPASQPSRKPRFQVGLRLFLLLSLLLSVLAAWLGLRLQVRQHEAAVSVSYMTIQLNVGEGSARLDSDGFVRDAWGNSGRY